MVEGNRTQGLNAENGATKCLLIGERPRHNSVTLPQFVPLVYVGDSQGIAQFNPAINIALESQKISASTECDASDLHRFFGFQNQGKPMPFED